MSYSSSAAALKLVPKLADVEATKLDWDAIATHADQLIDLELTGLFQLPFNPVPAGIQTIAAFLYAGLANAQVYTETDPQRLAPNFFYDKAMSLLKRIRSGSLQLPASVPLDESTAALAAVADSSTRKARPIFNQGSELDWEDRVLDPDPDSPTFKEPIDPEDL